MAYKIAVASTEGMHVDQSFREAKGFLIIDVAEDGNYRVEEIRKYENAEENERSEQSEGNTATTNMSCGNHRVCGGQRGCGGANSPKFLLVQDCRCLVCTQIGFKVQKSLEKKAISTFEVDCQVDEALKKIIGYFEKVDKHQSLRGIARRE